MAEYNNNITIGGNVPDRIPVRADIQTFTNALNQITQRADQVTQKASEIDLALSQADLDESENPWLDKKREQIKTLLSDPYDDISSNFRAAITMASDVTKELAPRIRYNAEYKQAKKEVESRNDINDITKKAWALTNKYDYEDEFDGNGKFIGGTNWKENWRPVEDVDDLQMMYKAVQMIAPESNKSTKTWGDSTTKADGTSSGGQHERGGGYERLTYDRIKKQLTNIIDKDDKWRSSLQQSYFSNLTLYNDAKAKYDNATTEEEKKRYEADMTLYGSALKNKDGIVTSDYVDILFAKYPDVIKNFAYNNKTSSMTDINNTDDYVKSTGSNGNGSNGGYEPGARGTGTDSVYGSPGQPDNTKEKVDLSYVLSLEEQKKRENIFN